MYLCESFIESSMKKLLLLAAIIVGLTASAADKFNIVNIELADGAKEQLLLHEQLIMKMNGSSTLLLIHPEITVEYQLPEIQRIDFGYNEDAPLYNGEHEFSALDEALAPRRIEITPEAIKGAENESIEAFDLNGRKVAAATGSLSTSQLPAGAIYIVRIGSTSLKIKR